jgi:phenylpropionate dioxygenase-like ring-hydroxylating dioxygenase large terminal subunit
MKTFLDAVLKPPAEAATLPPAVYSRADVYALEVEHIFKKSWLLVGRVDRMPNPGDFDTCDLFGSQLVVVRDQDGGIQCYSRVCLHRGAELVSGRGHRRLFVCPYHAWSYGLDGRLRAAPYMDEACNFDFASQRLPAVRTEVWHGFVFVNFDPDAQPLAAQIPGFDAFAAPYRFGDLVLMDEYLEFDSPWNWKVLCENFMEAYHHPTTHNPLLQAPFPVEASYVLENHGEPWSVLAMPNPSNDLPLTFPPIPGLDDWRRHGLVAAILFPNTLLGLTGDAALWYQMIPHSYDRFTLRIRFLIPKDTLALDDFAERYAAYRAFIEPVHLQDIGVNNATWAGLCSAGARQGRLHPRYELAIWQMNQWWCERMAEVLA